MTPKPKQGEVGVPLRGPKPGLGSEPAQGESRVVDACAPRFRRLPSAFQGICSCGWRGLLRDSAVAAKADCKHHAGCNHDFQPIKDSAHVKANGYAVCTHCGELQTPPGRT